MVAANGNFIAKATANSHGQFRGKAKAAGMSTAAYAKKKAHAPGVTGKQARLAATLMGLNKGKKPGGAAEDAVGKGADEKQEND